MTKLNWRDASKELPKGIGEDGDFFPECIIRVKLTMSDGEVRRFNSSAFYNLFSESFDHQYKDDFAEITHWIYVKEIPLPEE